MKQKTNSKQAGQIKINKDMTIGEVTGLYPETIPVLLENGIHCVGCHVANWETLEQGFRGHYGMDDNKVNELVSILNQVINEKEKEMRE